MIILLSMLIMFHALLFLLLAMPKYNKQISVFPKRDKKLESNFRHVGYVLLVICIALLIVDNGVGVGIALVCGLLTFLGSLVSVMFTFNQTNTAASLIWLPKKIFGVISSSSAYFYLVGYGVLVTSFTLFF
ncbi:hypothetical protein C1E24_20685 [Pseudoalteromonas phenolica]|uniref:DUF3325 domain-containing protein n=1 Tax=Pseudoalteromonas phenolica TaxID=161398 RepID=A0A5R9PWB3_9GAMM|nr:DUF3325 family protein [Pseudoalteromonas phenolica]TLX45111.1 hypothetical protein C1E24_20685 [Pseudoalteromonas phenolica]